MNFFVFGGWRAEPRIGLRGPSEGPLKRALGFPRRDLGFPFSVEVIQT